MLISRACHFRWAVDSSSARNPEKTRALTLLVNGDLSILGVRLGAKPRLAEAAERPFMADDNLRSISSLFLLSVKTNRTEQLSLK